jgi:carboxymethylenebutenolidase
MTRDEVTIQTRDGACRASFFRPGEGQGQGEGPWPAVLMYMDGIGYRPALFGMAQRLADAGYVVLLPDLFYRAGPYEPPDPKKVFSDPATREAWRKFIGSATIAGAMSDTAAFLDWLAQRPDVRPSRIGTTGYCLGGRFSLAAAGHHGDRVAAAASFHGAQLANDAPDSPHLLAARMTRTKVYVAGAVEDASFPDDMKLRLEEALTAAGVDHRIETYEGLRHGWVPSDTPVHSPEGAERHFRALVELFGSTLRAS